jgi:hypothetical protein
MESGEFEFVYSPDHVQMVDGRPIVMTGGCLIFRNGHLWGFRDPICKYLVTSDDHRAAEQLIAEARLRGGIRGRPL